MSEPVEASSSSESSSSSNNVEGDPGIAWEERRKAWLTPNEKGKRRATQATIDRLSSVLAYDSNIQTQEAAAERIILGIKSRLAGKEGLKEPMPLSLMVTLLYKSWLLDGTIDAKMLKEGRAATDDEQIQDKKQT
ncbi:hypothetical protein P389DRAFT_194645 [Cystobasidium minutum MCA 4210]|uniref:uncharacterized protein n=1 Tax=Cystobasidium minutum MCA 4210 TaxID=1397322 RepID=UPI0034CDDD94|eukprot:jgi/Rhomi1/194645/gm1.2859_g